MNIKIALLQFDIAWEDTGYNLKYLTKALMNLEEDTDVLILPEMFHCGFSMAPENNDQVDGGEVLEWMKNTANELGIAIMGSAIVQVQNKYFNRLYVVHDGTVNWYDKRHLFTMGEEHMHYQRGLERLIIEVKGWRICPLICYDLRFPVWSRNTGHYYDVLVYVANWPAARRDVWNTLLKARAIENQSYVIGVNRIGKDNQLEYAGDSQAINARGQVALNCGDQEGLFYVILNRVELDVFRTKFPVLGDADEFSLNP
ncbi:amidohydrolase [Carboxylicivirga mesophila]|uniref:Amidohydrolase n=1 Tax=Carboxylicivirga mesophila TaxID=1166478 RepID=A0ABS5KEA6_9BACT|nr:amidohydrolase [Carboxylicivirga mesophila]MBS2213207.1 amidohydrolase [Carboxylicivirga mesophila]